MKRVPEKILIRKVDTKRPKEQDIKHSTRKNQMGNRSMNGT